MPRGGPDGGDGGSGGDVWLVADHNVASLLAFRDHPHRRAADGTHGSGKGRHGRRRRRPRGPGAARAPSCATTTARCSPTWCAAGDRYLAAEGGRGGRGNARFLSNRRRAPAFAEQGEEGEERWLRLELKLLADVALVGFPNVGKSTLICAHLGGQAQDRRLPVHHARAQPRRRAPRRRHRVRRGRHPRPHRGRQRGPGPRPPVPPPHRAGPGPVRPARPGAGRRAAARPSSSTVLLDELAPTSPSCSSATGSSWAAGPTWPPDPTPTRWDVELDLRISAVTGAGIRAAARAGWPRLVRRARAAEPEPEPVRRAPPVPRGLHAWRGRAAAGSSRGARPSGPSTCPTSPTHDALDEAHRRLQAARRRPGAGPGRRPAGRQRPHRWAWCSTTRTTDAARMIVVAKVGTSSITDRRRRDRRRRHRQVLRRGGARCAGPATGS